MSSIREVDYSEADFAACAALFNAAHPDWPMSAYDLEAEYRIRDPKHAREYYLLENRGFIELGHAYWYDVEGKMYAKFESSGEFADQELLEFTVARLSSLGGRKLLTFSRITRSPRTTLLVENGFSHVQTEPISRLDPGAFNFEFAEAHEARARQSGVEVMTLEQFSALDPEYRRKVYDHTKACLRDVPSPDPVEPAPFDIWIKRLEEDSWYDYGTYVVAVKEGEVVGTSGMHPCLADPTLLFTGLTGVHKDYRRMGIATTMKAMGARIAQSRGIRAVMTDNDSTNPMFDLNVRLGFEEYDAWLHYERPLA